MIEMISLILSILGIVLGGLALGVGLYHIYEIRQQAGELRTQAEEAAAHTKKLDKIRRELSTRFIGQFPEYLEEIVKILDNAEEIMILCDFPAYGAFSDRANFLKYRATLEQKLNDDKKVELTCFDRSQRMRTTREQFLQTTWEEWKQKPENDKRIKTLVGSRSIQPSAISEDEFISLLEEDDTYMLENLRKFTSADVREAGVHIPLYFWLCDDRVAIFAILSLSGKAVEYGFRTTDPQLLDAFTAMGEHYRRLSGSAVVQPPPVQPLTHP